MANVEQSPSQTPSEDPSVRVFLKKETTAVHDALDKETVKIFRSAGSPEAAREIYKQLLEANYGLIGSIEEALHANSEVQAAYGSILERAGIPLKEMEKARLLFEDLLSLGKSIPEIKALERPSPDLIPTPKSLPHIAGVLYVLEGSSVGGPVVAGMIQKFTGLESKNCRFLEAYGDFPTARERFNEVFSPALDLLVTDESAQKEALQGAFETFNAFSEWYKAKGLISG